MSTIRLSILRMATPGQPPVSVVDRNDAILARIRQGDSDSFRLLMRRYRDHVAAIVAGHIPGDRVEEVIQDVFVSAYRSLETYAGSKNFQHWLSRIAVRRCHDFWRAAYRRRELVQADLSPEASAWLQQAGNEDADAAAGRQQQQREARELVNWALARLSAADRTVLTLVHLQDHSVRETADLLGWSQANVKVRAMRARRKLRKILEQEATP